MSIKSKLRVLTRRRPTSADIEEINRQIESENNQRGAALLAATPVENALVWAITSRIASFSSHYVKLFENEGLFSTFDSRITIAHSLYIFGSETLHNLDTVKHVTNAFAHAGVPVTFGTDEIAAACHTLRAPPNLRGKIWDSPRNKFVTVCYAVTSDLFDYALKCRRSRADLLEPTTIVPVVPASLP
jgi:hypothetical protein